MSTCVTVGEIIRHEKFPEVLELLLGQRSLVVLLHGLQIPDTIINSTYHRVCREFKVYPRSLSSGDNLLVDDRITEIKRSLIALKPSIPLEMVPSTTSSSDVSTSTSTSSFSSSTSPFSASKISSRRINKNAVSILVAWMVEHNADPYPSPLEKTVLASETNLTVNQVTTWLTNFRKRIILPVVNKKKQPKNRLDHLFSLVSKADKQKLSLISKAIRNGHFHKSTRHHMTSKEFQAVYNNNFAPLLEYKEPRISLLEEIQQSSLINSSESSSSSSLKTTLIDEVDDYDDNDDDYGDNSSGNENFLLLGELMDVEELDKFEFMKDV